MYTTTILTFFACVLSVLAGLSIQSPAAISSCTPVTLKWNHTADAGFSAVATPYTIEVLDANEPCDEALFSLGKTNSTSIMWSAPPVQAGAKLIISVTDKTGLEVWSNPVTVKAGVSSTCLTAASGTSTPPAISSGGGGASLGGNNPVVNPEGAVSASSRITSGASAVVLLGLISLVLL